MSGLCEVRVDAKYLLTSMAHPVRGNKRGIDGELWMHDFVARDRKPQSSTLVTRVWKRHFFYSEGTGCWLLATRSRMNWDASVAKRCEALRKTINFAVSPSMLTALSAALQVHGAMHVLPFATSMEILGCERRESVRGNIPHLSHVDVSATAPSSQIPVHGTGSELIGQLLSS